jgi:hypothetical protein
VLETQQPNDFSMPQHCYEYCNTLGWFYDTFDHPQRLKLLYVAASFLNRAAWHQQHIGDLEPAAPHPPAAAVGLSRDQLLERIEAAITALDGPAARSWTQAYLDSAADRAPLVQRLAVAACRLGNDPHNQEIAQCFLEDYGKNEGWDRDRLLLACVQHTAVHRKYGDPLEASRRFARAMNVAMLS